MNRTMGYWLPLVFAVIAAPMFFELGNSPLKAAPVSGVTEKAEATASFTATFVFGLGQGQKARFCVGTLDRSGATLDWIVPISDERGVILLQLPDVRSPAGEWRCLDVPRSSIPVTGEPTTGRVQVAARELIKAPAGTRVSDIVGSFEIVNADGTTAGAIAGIVISATTDNNR